jgi:hypothetical protein
MSEHYIRASELRSFAFCRRAWFLEQGGEVSTLQAERRRGTVDHREHGASVIQAANASRFSSILFAMACIALTVAIFLWWLAR